MSFTCIIDHESLLALLHDQGGNQRTQLASLEEIGTVSRPAGEASRNHVQMCARERLVQEHTSRLEQVGERLEQRSIEKVDTDNRVECVAGERQRVRVRHDADYSIVPSGRGDHGTVNEVHEDDRSRAAGDRFCMTAGASSHVEDERVDGQSGALLNDPPRRGVLQLTPALSVPRIPFVALATPIEIRAH